MSPQVSDMITVLGLLVFLQLVFSALVCVLKAIRVLVNMTFPPNYPKKYGPWAVVTGGSDGIGLQYARELARRGMNVVLMSYAKEQLLEAAKKIEIDFKVETKTIVVDFSDGCQIYENIGKELKDLNIGILINNVGVVIPNPMKVDEMTEKQIWNHVSVNILAGTMMTKILLPEMKKRKRGAIVNVASASAIIPIPLLTVYSASKAYVDFLSRGLRDECASHGITVQTLTPLFVNTQLCSTYPSLRSGGLTVPSAKTFVKSAITTLGVLDHTSGYFPHTLQIELLKTLPAWFAKIIIKFGGKVLRNECDIQLGKKEK